MINDTRRKVSPAAGVSFGENYTYVRFTKDPRGYHKVEQNVCLSKTKYPRQKNIYSSNVPTKLTNFKLKNKYQNLNGYFTYNYNYNNCKFQESFVSNARSG